MADTLQIVSWAIERKCSFRTGEGFYLPSKTQTQLCDIRTLARAHADDRVVDGVCVTSWTMGDDNSGAVHDIPHSGFRVAERLGKFGGVEHIQQTCGDCEANVETELDTCIAGCFGHLEVRPHSDELDALLWNVIEKRNLETRLREAFKITTPLWYGFWIDSPLRRRQCEVLHELFNEACDYDSKRDDGIFHFIHALKAAMDWELPLHVSLAPLGHTDFDWYTVFPHCPRCTANAPVGRWKTEFSSEDFECKVCGNVFNPNEHHRSERMDGNWAASSLETQLGETEYENFTRRFLAHRGSSDKQTEEVIDNQKNGPLLREIANVRRKQNAQTRQLREKRKKNSDSK